MAVTTACELDLIEELNLEDIDFDEDIPLDDALIPEKNQPVVKNTNLIGSWKMMMMMRIFQFLQLYLLIKKSKILIVLLIMTDKLLLLKTNYSLVENATRNTKRNLSTKSTKKFVCG